MRIALAAVTVGVALSVVGSSAYSQQLPKSGSISFHTGFKYAADVTSPADKYVLGRGNSTGVTFNDKGSGPLHLGPANCFEGFLLIDGHGKDMGFCAFGDPDGDRIFTEYTGTLAPDGASGTNVVTGGTGKYAGIRGSGPWKCKGAGSNGELQCAQRMDYQLP